MSLERTLVILKPSAIQRGLAGEITHRFERKGLRLAGIKMMQLTDDLLNEHYAHLKDRPFFQRVKDSMMASPVIVCCYEGVDAVQIDSTLHDRSYQRTCCCSGHHPRRLLRQCAGKYRPHIRFPENGGRRTGKIFQA